jgi:hypothetical protein
MKTKYLYELEDVIVDFLSGIDHPGYCGEDLEVQMAQAAAAVYDACMSGQEYLKNNKE